MIFYIILQRYGPLKGLSTLWPVMATLKDDWELTLQMRFLALTWLFHTEFAVPTHECVVDDHHIMLLFRIRNY